MEAPDRLKAEILELGSRLRMQIEDLLRANITELKASKVGDSDDEGGGKDSTLHSDESERVKANARKHHQFALKVDILQRENLDAKNQLSELTSLISKKDQRIQGNFAPALEFPLDFSNLIPSLSPEFKDLQTALKKEAQEFEVRRGDLQNLVDRLRKTESAYRFLSLELNKTADLQGVVKKTSEGLRAELQSQVDETTRFRSRLSSLEGSHAQANKRLELSSALNTDLKNELTKERAEHLQHQAALRSAQEKARALRLRLDSTEKRRQEAERLEEQSRAYGKNMGEAKGTSEAEIARLRQALADVQQQQAEGARSAQAHIASLEAELRGKSAGSEGPSSSSLATSSSLAAVTQQVRPSSSAAASASEASVRASKRSHEQGEGGGPDSAAKRPAVLPSLAQGQGQGQGQGQAQGQGQRDCAICHQLPSGLMRHCGRCVASFHSMCARRQADSGVCPSCSTPF